MAKKVDKEQRPVVTPTGKKPGHWEDRTVNRRGAKAPFIQRFYVTDKDEGPKGRKKPKADHSKKLYQLYRKLGRLLREPELPAKVEARARKLREKISAILSAHRTTALAQIQDAVREVTGRKKRLPRPKSGETDTEKSDPYFVYLPLTPRHK